MQVILIMQVTAVMLIIIVMLVTVVMLVTLVTVIMQVIGASMSEPHTSGYIMDLRMSFRKF